MGFYFRVSVLNVPCSIWKQRLVKSLASRNEIKMIKCEDIAVCFNMKAANFRLDTVGFCRVQQGMFVLGRKIQCIALLSTDKYTTH
jgi:hypothetical protein